MEKKREKIHILGIFRSHVSVHLECVPVHPSRTEHVSVHVRGVPLHPALVFQFRPVFFIFAITCSFIIRFERFKWPIKIAFKENQT